MNKILKYKGITIIYCKHHRNNSSDVTFGIQTGSYTEHKSGLAHLMEHCFGHGTTTKSRAECEEFKIKHIPSFNAATGYNYVQMRFYESSRDLEKILQFSADVFFNFKTTPEDFEKEKKVIVNEIRRREQNNSHTLSITSQNQIYESKLSFDEVLGTEKSLKSIKIKDMERFKKENFCRENFLFSIVTNKSLCFIKKLIDKYFLPNLKSIPDFVKKQYVRTAINKKDSLKTIKKQDTRLCTIKITKEGLPYKKELVPRTDMVFKAIERPLGRVYDLFRNKHGLTYETPYFTWPSYDACGTVCFTLRVPAKDIKFAITLASELFTDLHKNGITKDEYDTIEILRKRAKDVSVKPAIRDSSTNNFDGYVVRGSLFPIREYRKYRKKETYNSINDYAKLLFAPNRLFVTILGNFEKKDVCSLSKMKKLFNIPSENK